MKTYLIFNDDEDNERNLALKGQDMFISLWDYDQALRGKLKYGHEFKDADEALEWARQELQEVMEAHGVHFDDFA
jgi:hypothetical protein